MSTPHHTPGPWAVSMPGGQTAFNGRRVTVTANGSMIADLDWNSPATNMANATLIAAAPELLAACKRMLPWLGKMIADNGHLAAVAPNDAVGAMHQAHAAITAAQPARAAATPESDGAK